MTTPDNARLLANERAASESEEAIAREEQALWPTLEAALADDSSPRAEALVSRLSLLANSADAPASLVSRAQALATKPQAIGSVPAATERETALAARQAALRARQAALQSMARGVAELEGERASRVRELDELDSLLERIETETRQAESARAAAQEAAARLAAEQAAEEAARKKAREQAAIEARVAAERAQTQATSPSVPVFDPNMTAPEVPMFPATDEAKTVIEMPALSVASVPAPGSTPEPTRAPTPIAHPASPLPAATASFSPASFPPAAAATVLPDSPPAQAPSASQQPPAAGRRRVSRRRRVKLAPPPRKLHVEVAEHGDDTFYTGWNESIADGGLFVVSLETLPPGHELDVEIEVAGKTIKSRGQVQFVRKDNISNPDCLSGAGIKLLDLSADNTSTIESFFAKRAPMFFVQR